MFESKDDKLSDAFIDAITKRLTSRGHPGLRVEDKED